MTPEEFREKAFATAVAVGAWQPHQREAFEAANKGMPWWRLGSYDTTPGWETKAPWKDAHDSPSDRKVAR